MIYSVRKKKTVLLFLFVMCIILFVLIVYRYPEDRKVFLSVKRVINEQKCKTFSVDERDNFVIAQTFKNTGVQIDYVIDKGVPNKLYTIEMVLTIKEMIYNQKNEPDIGIIVDNFYDVNSSLITCRVEKKDKSSYVIKRLVKTDNTGTINLTFYIGSDDNVVDGTFIIKDPQCIAVDKNKDYITFTNNRDIELIFSIEDFRKIHINEKQIYGLINQLSDLRKSIKFLMSEYEPYDGVTQYVFTEKIPFTALAGNPIYVNCEELNKIFSSIKISKERICKTDLVAVLCHEMSHTFDIISEPNTSAGYCFDREFFATLKEIYALYKNGYTIDYNFLSASPELSDNIYSYEVLLRRILERLNLLNNISNWSYVKDTLSILQDDRKSLEVGFSKFNKFIDFLSEKSRIDLYKIFSPQELRFLDNYFFEKTR